jgi:predicted TPR repeat methyltransferase
MSLADLLVAASTHVREGRLDQAESLYRQAIEQDPAAIAPRLNLAILLLDLARHIESTELLGQLVLEDPKLAPAWVYLARAAAAQGFDWEAHKAVEKALKANPDPETLLTASVLLLDLRDTNRAEAACRRAIAASPDSAAAWIQLGHVLEKQEDIPGASAAYQRALALEPVNQPAAFFLAAISAGEAGSPAPGAPVVTQAPREYIRSLFDAYAPRFDTVLVTMLNYQVPTLLQRMLADYLAQKPLTDPIAMTILDAGCGTGLCAQWLAEYRGRLIGVDLSRQMIHHAAERKSYDELLVADLFSILRDRRNTFDLIVAADVLLYFGDLAPFFSAAANALRPGGLLLLSVEATTQADFTLLPTQRFAHSLPYLNHLATASRLTVESTHQATLRRESNKDVPGYLLLARKNPALPTIPVHSPQPPRTTTGEPEPPAAHSALPDSSQRRPVRR